MFVKVEDSYEWSDPKGSKTLLILTPPSKHSKDVMKSDERAILERVLEFAKVYGTWRHIILRQVQDDTITKMAKDAEADAVLLFGGSLARTLGQSTWKDMKVDDPREYMGLLAKIDGRRWVASWPIATYNILDKFQKTDRKNASLLGHLMRHLELLRVGFVKKMNTGPIKIRLIKSRKMLETFLEHLTVAEKVAIDTEGHNLNRIKNTIITIQFSFDEDSSWVLPIHHADSELTSDDLAYAFKRLKRYFEQGKKAVHFYAAAAFDLHQLYSLFDLRWYNHKVYDVQSAEFCLDEQRMYRKSLGIAPYTLERIALEWDQHHYEKSPIAKHDRDKMFTFSLQDVADYGGLDTALLLRIYRGQMNLAKYRDSIIPSRPYRTFFRTVTQILGVQSMQFVAMERNGLLVDKDYSIKAQTLDSLFAKEEAKLTKELMESPEVIEANRRLLARAKRSERTLFAKQKAWIFSLSDKKHLSMLFFDVCKLRPLEQTDSGLGRMNKTFIQAYENDNWIVEKYASLRQLKTLQATFITGIYKVLTTHPDNLDGRIHMWFMALQVITGRSSSTSPNSQNIPNRGPRAKGIKRQFISKKPRLFVKRDFSAHEIRGWGAVAKDPVLANTFWTGMKTRLEYAALRQVPTGDIESEWSIKLRAADVHRQNYQLLYGVRADLVNEDQRDSVKAPIFGKVYGLADATLGKNFLKTAVSNIEKLMRTTRIDISKIEDSFDSLESKEQRVLARTSRKELLVKMKQLEKDLEKADDEKFWDKKATEVSDLIFNKTFKVGGKWLKTINEKARKTLRVRSPVGRVRHLYGHLHTDRSVWSAMDRRGPNSDIQGFGSDMGFVGGYMMRKIVWEFFEQQGIELDYIQCNTVHDSTETECHPILIPLIEYLHHHAFTTMVHRFLRDEFDFELPVGFEMDAEIGASLSAMISTTGKIKGLTFAGMPSVIRKSLEWGNENLAWGINVDKYMPIVEHNAKIIHNIRRKEIARQLDKGIKTNYDMIMTKENCLSWGLVFSLKEWKELQNTRQAA